MTRVDRNYDPGRLELRPGSAGTKTRLDVTGGPALGDEGDGLLVQPLGAGAPLDDAAGLDEPGVRHLVGQHRGVGGGADRDAGVADDQGRALDLPAAPAGGR